MKATTSKKFTLELEDQEVRMLQVLLRYDASVPAMIRKLADGAVTADPYVRDNMRQDADELESFMPRLYNEIQDNW